MANEQPIRIMIIEHHFLVRVGLAALISSQPDMAIIAEARNCSEALELLKKYNPDITLLDLQLPGMRGASLVREIIKGQPEARILVMTAPGKEEETRSAIRAGAKSYCVKQEEGQDLVKAIRALHDSAS
ncbi:MAG: DNA-binding response regulator [Acidobacteria bacterium]|nr:MAG: DNA-binding response regulator [Acidobacteriota bacterium]RPJ63164.1 MAG: DNA-binding response regulator [Acidobacteriota bacterium]